MRGILLAVAGLILGAVGALGYSHFLGDGRQLADAQAALAQARQAISVTAVQMKVAGTETRALSDQIDQLTASNADLKKQIDAAKTASATPPPAPAASPFGLNGAVMKMAMEQHTESELLKLKSRLHLTPEQEAAVKAALDAEGQRGQDMAAKMMAGGKIDPQAMAAEMKNVKSVDQTLNEILTPEQKTTYQQMQADQKNSDAEMMASVELNQMTPLLQLTDAQKDQVYNAIAQTQIQTQDPKWVQANANPSDPLAFIDAQAKAKEDALSKIFTPDQLATYHQQAQTQLDMQKAVMKNFSAGGATAVSVSAVPPATTTPAPPPAVAPAAAPTNP
jgi:hypothetical protein